ncbi:Uncharacterised protein [Mycobacteroides abscessus subsp. abscessus]|nr:Uncharacterised protein [Mycobacteroides abscessus subsp. abscessus]
MRVAIDSCTRSLTPVTLAASSSRAPCTGCPASRARRSTSVRYSSCWALAVDNRPIMARRTVASKA